MSKNISAGWYGIPIGNETIKMGGSKNAVMQWEEVSKMKAKRKKEAELRKERKTKRVVNTKNKIDKRDINKNKGVNKNTKKMD